MHKNDSPFIYSEYDTNYLDSLKNQIHLIPICSKDLFNEYKNTTNKLWTQIKYDTLIAKILLGILGITLAYNRFFKVGVAEKNIIQTFSIDSLNQLIQFYYNNITDFNTFNQYKYPPMKLVDIYFWQLGFDIFGRTI